jgi:two-component system cell cycle sensor histidine kinase/response regulator CckA
MSEAPDQDFRGIVDRMPIGIVIHRERRILYANRICLHALGLERLDDLLGRDPVDLLAPDERPKHAQRIAAIARGEAVQPAQARLPGNDGRSYVIEVVGYLAEFEGQPAIVSVIRDVTGHQALKEQFQQAQKLESIGRLASGIAHDFNNILTVILSCVESLEEAVRNDSPLNAEEIDEIRAAGERARDLTARLLSVARKQVVAPVPLDLNVVVRATEKLLRRILRENVELVTKLDIGAWNVRSDPGLIEQVVLNLAVNAHDAMPNGGRLTIETANVEADARVTAGHPWMRGGQYTRLVVRDTGHGMSAEVKAHLFEPFFTTKARGLGTGLGLATVYGIVKQSGGCVLVESTPGYGTTFEIYLPRTLELPPSPQAPGDRTAMRGTETILLIEDDPQVREVAVRSLQAAGYRVLAARDVSEALALTEDDLALIDLVISDVIVPGGSGPRLAETLRHRRPTLRILYVSGFTWEAISEEGPPVREIDFLPKPFTASSLLARVRAVLDAR